jgi:hypothetical protein
MSGDLSLHYVESATGSFLLASGPKSEFAELAPVVECDMARPHLQPF